MDEIIQISKEVLSRLNSGKSARVLCKLDVTAELILREISTKTDKKVLYLQLKYFGIKNAYLFFTI